MPAGTTPLALTTTLAPIPGLTCNDSLDWVDAPVGEHEAVWRVIVQSPPGVVVAEAAFAGAVAHLVRVFVHGLQTLRLAQRLPVLRVVVQHLGGGLRGRRGGERGGGLELGSR